MNEGAGGVRVEHQERGDIQHQALGAGPLQALRRPGQQRARGGDIGRAVRRTPAAFDTALATAASGGTIDVGLPQELHW